MTTGTVSSFGIALRGWRERVSPSEAGLAVVPGAETGRRVRGLRRAELATAAGLSVDYVVRLEQGRARHPSPQVVAALARVLRLSAAERDHLFRCADLMPPSSGNIPLDVPSRVERLAHRMGGNPVAVFAADWTLVSWNAMWTATIGEPGVYGWAGRNLVAGMFRSVGGRRPESIAAWPVRSCLGDRAEEEALVADLRVTAAAYPADVRLAALVDGMIRANPRFARLWSGGSAGAVGGDRKTVVHPLVGDIELELDILTVAGTDFRVAAYTADQDTAHESKLDTLRAGLPVPPPPTGSRRA
ncbi:helix-turn-helix transcriptional regulator [Streptomyces fuscichromogenes]|uniref:Transcriptional regulator n=1 Tax=Streptomyces fuscichromogenes TaxID=1324013 RepID=A0A918CVZ5_9ACTN|nr:helix-turn-helix transcriptional regulator [Streptomyces fuscichromogenes]GGN36307.1 transcriptional regulator [Streptomyces fuscichromogenes]